MSMKSLVDNDQNDNLQDHLIHVAPSVGWEVLPSLSQIAETFAHSKRLMGVCEDRNGSELFKIASLTCDEVLRPLVFEAVLAIQAPHTVERWALVRNLKGQSKLQ